MRIGVRGLIGKSMQCVQTCGQLFETDAELYIKIDAMHGCRTQGWIYNVVYSAIVRFLDL